MNTQRSQIPAIGILVQAPALRELADRYGHEIVAHAARHVISRLRSAHDGAAAIPDTETVVRRIVDAVVDLATPSLKRVINATGIILHTNLGRAPLGRNILEDISPVVTGYSNLEFDLETGRRGHRNDHIAALLTFLTGAEDAIVVNNNAAGIILALHSLARRKEVIISRGELIEIGGAFRIPDIMAAGGVKMIEVGTTNRTRLSDYEQAISPRTALIFKAHKSNYAIRGFIEEVSVKNLSALARARGLPFIYDIGSGLFRKPRCAALAGEPDVRSAIDEGADCVTFSCDKLIGGPQAGIVAGKKELVGRLAKAPLMRALRVGKLTIAALHSAARQYLSDDLLKNHNPAFAMLEQSGETIARRTEMLRRELAARAIDAVIVDSKGQAGGGSIPESEIPSCAIVVRFPETAQPSPEKLFRHLLAHSTPVIPVIREGRLELDMLAVSDDEIPVIADALEAFVPAARLR